MFQVESCRENIPIDQVKRRLSDNSIGKEKHGKQLAREREEVTYVTRIKSSFQASAVHKNDDDLFAGEASTYANKQYMFRKKVVFKYPSNLSNFSSSDTDLEQSFIAESPNKSYIPQKRTVHHLAVGGWAEGKFTKSEKHTSVVNHYNSTKSYEHDEYKIQSITTCSINAVSYSSKVSAGGRCQSHLNSPQLPGQPLPF